MGKIIIMTLLSVLYSSFCMAISESDIDSMLKSSAEFRDADKFLNETWKQVTPALNKNNKAFLLKMQRDWLKSGRDEAAREYMDMGYSKNCAYAIATRSWAKTLLVFQYNAGLSEEDAGRAKADDAFFDEAEDIPASCKPE